MVPGPDHGVMVGARDVDMDLIANYLPAMGGQGRPILNKTGLTGTFDFSINWTPTPPTPGGGDPPNNSGPTFEQAMREQLGLRLKPARAPVRTLVIDHAEQLSPN